jgi:hypothetical protein
MDNTTISFQWPDDPNQDFWEITGAGLGLSTDAIRFAAALFMLGGADARKNSQAAKLASLDWDRVHSFRVARSVGVRKLLSEAARIKSGRLPPLTEADIDRKIDDLIRCPDAQTVARGIELRERRKENLRRREAAAAEAADDPDANLRNLICALPESGLGAALALGCFFHGTANIVNFPHIKLVAPLVSRTHPVEWARWREKHEPHWHSVIDEWAAGPVLSGDQIVAALTVDVPTKPKPINSVETADAD